MAFMDDVDALIKPDDLVQCLNEHPPQWTISNHFQNRINAFITMD
jgi:hypothetical protein